MNKLSCPTCDTHLKRQEALDGFCDGCGKRLPVWMASRALAQRWEEDRKSVARGETRGELWTAA